MADFTNIRKEDLNEIVAVFQNVKDMENAIDDLTSNGFNQAEISMLADEKKVKEKLGNDLSVETLMDNPDAPRVSYVANENIGAAQGSVIGGLAYISSLAAAGTVIAVGGPISAAFATAAIAGGTFATMGALIAKLIGQHHADYLEGQINNGGIIVWIRIRDFRDEDLAMNILKQHNAEHLHTHQLAYHSNELELELSE